MKEIRVWLNETKVTIVRGKAMNILGNVPLAFINIVVSLIPVMLTVDTMNLTGRSGTWGEHGAAIAGRQVVAVKEELRHLLTQFPTCQRQAQSVQEALPQHRHRTKAGGTE